MSMLAYDDLPDVQRSVKARPLFAMRLSVRPLQVVGETPVGVRRIGVVFGGVFEGERLSGEVLDGGSDWQILRPDSVLTLDVRLVLKTTDGAVIGMTYRGLRHGASMCCNGSIAVSASIPRATTSASIRCSRRHRQSTTGSTASSASASVTAMPMGRSTACSRFCEVICRR